MSHVNRGSSGSVPYHRLDLRWAGSCCLTQVRAGSLSALSIGCFSYRQRDECVEAKHKVWTEKCLEADASAGWLVEEQAAAACVGVLSVLFGHIEAWIRSKYVLGFKFQPTKHYVGETQANVMLNANTSILRGSEHVHISQFKTSFTNPVQTVGWGDVDSGPFLHRFIVRMGKCWVCLGTTRSSVCLVCCWLSIMFSCRSL